MAKTKISEFSSTPGSNTDIDGINISEGCAPSGINDAIRELMAQLKDWQSGTSNDPYVVGSSGSLTLNQGTANGVPYLNGSKVVTSGSALTFDGTNFATTGSVTSAGSSNSGNLAFTGTGNRITGDFSNATHANRVSFQSSTTNGATTPFFIPNGTGNTAGIVVANASDPTNCSFGQLVAGTTSVAVVSSILGTGSYLPMTFSTGGSESMRVDTSGNLGIGTTSPTFTSGSGLEIERTDATSTIRLQRAGTSPSSMEIRSGANTGEIFVTSNSPLLFATNGSERMRLDSSGNLGLGVTPSAWTTYKAFQYGNTASIVGANSFNIISNNWYYDGADRYIVTGQAVSQYYQNSGQHVWRTAPSGTAGNAISFTQAMTLDASGNLGIGTTSPGERLRVTSTGTNEIRTHSSSSGDARVGFWAEGSVYNYIQSVRSSGALGYFADLQTFNNGSGTERMRINSSGNLLVNWTGSAAYKLFVSADSAGSDYPAAFNNANTGSSNQIVVDILRNNSRTGYITNTNTATSYTSTSDYRLKEQVQPMTGALDRVAALKPVTYKWKVDGSDGQGFIAHELAEVVPDCVSGEKDAVDAEGNPQYQGIDTSFLVATLTAALQEAHGLIKDLQSRVAALEAK